MPLYLGREGWAKKEPEMEMEMARGREQQHMDGQLDSPVTGTLEGVAESQEIGDICGPSAVQVRAGIGGQVEVVAPLSSPPVVSSVRTVTPPAPSSSAISASLATSKWTWWTRKASVEQAKHVGMVVDSSEAESDSKTRSEGMIRSDEEFGKSSRNNISGFRAR